jgi:hypothetical protein
MEIISTQKNIKYTRIITIVYFKELKFNVFGRFRINNFKST